MTDLTTEVLVDDRAFDGIESEWDELLDDSLQCVFFLRWDWNRLWWKMFRPQGARLFLVTIRDSAGRLVGLAPFYWRQRRTAGIPHVRELLFLGTGVYAQTSEYLDVIARRGWESVVAGELCGYLRRVDCWDRLWLNEVPARSVMLPLIEEGLGAGVRLEVANRSYKIDTTGDWNSFKSGLGRATRQSIFRRTRQLFRDHDCKFGLVTEAGQLNRAMESLVKLHQARWQSKGEPGTFAIPRAEAFLREAMRRSFADGKLRLWTLELDGEIKAVQLAFFDNGTVHCFQCGFDPAHAKKRLGSVLMGLCIRACIEDESVREFDFMGGSDPYKESWCKASMESLVLTRLRAGGRVLTYQAIERAKGVGKTLVRATVPAPIRIAGYKMMIHRRHYSK